MAKIRANTDYAVKLMMAFIPNNKNYVLKGRSAGKLFDQNIKGKMNLDKMSRVQARYDRRHGAAVNNPVNKMINLAGTPGRYVNEALRRKNYGQAALRAGTMAAGYAGVMGAARAVTTDAGMLHDSQGNFDIAGIPFI